MAHVRKRIGPRGTGWQVRYLSPDDRERTKTFTRKADAERFLASVETDKARGEWTDPRLGKISFSDWAAQVEAGRVGRRESTKVRDEAVLRNLILPTFGALALATIQPEQIRAWIVRLVDAGKAPATVRRAYQHLALILDQAVTAGRIPKSPCRGIDLPRPESTEMRFLSVDEVEAVATAIDPRYRALVLAAAYTGMRFGELAGLKVPRLDLLRRTIRVEQQVTEVRGKLVVSPLKTKASRRSIALPTALVAALEEHLATYPPKGGYVFTAPDGGPLRRNHFRRRFWLPAVAASVGEPCRFHDLRHTAASLLIAAGAHHKVIQGRLGHTSIRTTLDIYGHLFEGYDDAAADALDLMITKPRKAAAVVPLHPD